MSAEGELFLAGFIVLLFVIVLPIVIAFARRHPNRWLILILVVAAGATVIGWLIALVWSLHGFHRSEGPVRNGGESGLNFYGNDDGLLADDHATVPEPEPEPEPAEARRRSSTDVGELHERPVPVSSAVAQLERLIALREAGDIDGSEYEALKRTIVIGEE